MIDSDLARLYDVETKHLNKAVKRNSGRFPEDFMFQLTEQESMALRFRFGTSNKEPRSLSGNDTFCHCEEQSDEAI